MNDTHKAVLAWSLNRHAERGRELTAAEVALCMGVPCSLCRSRIGKACTKPSGPRRRPHVERRIAAGLLPPRTTRG